MANTFLQFVMRRLKWEVAGKILGMIPEKVRKIVGWILLIFGAVAMLGGWFVAFSFSPPEMGIIIFIVGIFSFAYGIILLRHKG